MKSLLIAGILVLSGTVKDKGYQLVNGQIKPQNGSNLILTVSKDKVIVRAR